MASLTEQKCTHQSGHAMERDELQSWLSQLTLDWSVDNDAGHIEHDFIFRGFHETMSFVNAVAWIVNQQDHHPDMELGYKHCLVRFSTHSVGGLSINDFICAARVEALVESR